MHLPKEGMIAGIPGPMAGQLSSQQEWRYGEAREEYEHFSHKIHSGLLGTNTCLALEMTGTVILIYSLSWLLRNKLSQEKQLFCRKPGTETIFLCCIDTLNSIPAIPLRNSSSLKCLCHSSLVRSVSSWALQCSWCPKSWKMWLMSQVMEEQAVYLPVCQAEQLLFFSSFLYSEITVHYITNPFDHFKSILIDFKWKNYILNFCIDVMSMLLCCCWWVFAFVLLHFLIFRILFLDCKSDL